MTHHGHCQKEENPRVNGGFLWRAIHTSPAFRLATRVRRLLGCGRFLRHFPLFPPSLTARAVNRGFRGQIPLYSVAVVGSPRGMRIMGTCNRSSFRTCLPYCI